MGFIKGFKLHAITYTMHEVTYLVSMSTVKDPCVYLCYEEVPFKSECRS